MLIFREMHNLWRLDMLHRELLAVRGLLKDDGMLGIEQHRAKAECPGELYRRQQGLPARSAT